MKEKIENEKDLKMKYVVFKIDDIKQILDITEQQSFWSMLDKIVQYKQSELDDIISKNKSDRVARRIQTQCFLHDIHKKFSKEQAEQIEQLLDSNGLHVYDM